MRTMDSTGKTMISVRVRISAPVDKVWKCWTTPEDIAGWNHASPDWHTTRTTNDLRPGGNFSFRMEARDGSTGFDLEGVYTLVRNQEVIEYRLADWRRVKVTFSQSGNETELAEAFEAENSNPVELQRKGWQAILDNFKTYVESSKP
jgi:uncharacterized protein YndB with AHSA1/START domain